MSTKKESLANTLHARYRGKVQIAPKVPVRGLEDFAVWYTPGVADPCQAIAEDPKQVWEMTNRGNTVAIVSDGTRVLGLGDIGPEASLPVMEGKSLIFKLLGGVDAIPLVLRAPNPESFIATVQALEPTFGGISLEDIAQPKCFGILERLRDTMDIPVWHDDQQGTATVVLAAVLNTLKLVGKSLAEVKIAMLGMGAANVANYRLLKAGGADPTHIIACDALGTLHRGRADLKAQAAIAPQWGICQESNSAQITGGAAEAIRDADILIAFSRPGPHTIDPQWITQMAPNAIVIAGANPIPEILPAAAHASGAHIVCTGRSDFPNQVNNALAFPGIFRGVLDVQARAISTAMAVSAAVALAECATTQGLREDHVLPTLDEPATHLRIAVATALAAQEAGLVRRPGSEAEIQARCSAALSNSGF